MNCEYFYLLCSYRTCRVHVFKFSFALTKLRNLLLKGFHLMPQEELELKKKGRYHKSCNKTVTVRIFVPSQHSYLTLLANLTEVSLIALCFKCVSKIKGRVYLEGT